MDQRVKQLLEEQLNENLVQIMISNSDKKEEISKIKIRPVEIKGTLQFQCTLYKGTQVFHQNEEKDSLSEKILLWLDMMFHQMEIQCLTTMTTVLISKKKTVTIKKKALQIGQQQEQKVRQERVKMHNRGKRYIIPEGKPVPFLVDLGIMTQNGEIVRAKYDKFRQINRYLEFVEDILEQLPKDRELTIVDFGCGKSYLTFVMYYYLVEIKNYHTRIIGLDLKKDVISYCNQLAKRYGFQSLEFLCGDIKDYTGVDQVDMVVTLHACDTATDYALYKAVTWGASVIFSVPCCQHELNRQINCEPLQPLFQYGLIKEKTSALFTDALRANCLELQGYQVQLLEFIDMEHTPKNILIRAIRKRGKDSTPKAVNQAEYEEMIRYLGVNPTLYQLFKSKEGVTDETSL